MQTVEALNAISYARTAASEPGSIMDADLVSPHGWPNREAIADYVVDRCDDAIAWLDSELRPRRCLSTCGRLIAEVADRMGDTDLNPSERVDLADRLHAALDVVDEAIQYLGRYPLAGELGDDVLPGELVVDGRTRAES